MTSLAKLIERIKRCPPEVSFGDIHRVMTAYGAELRRTKGSHHHYRYKGNTLPVPVHDAKVAREYVRQVIDFLGLKEDDDDQGEGQSR